MITRAVIPAAGFGTRLSPLSRVVPKELLPLGRKPVIQWAVEEALAAGIERIAIVIREGKEAIPRFFREHGGFGKQLRFLRQEQPAGVANAIAAARSWTAGEPFAVLMPDNVFIGGEPVIGRLIAGFEAVGTTVAGLALLDFSDEMYERNGVIYGAPGARGMVEILSESGATAGKAGCYRGIGRDVYSSAFFPALDEARGAVQGELDDVHVLERLMRVEQVHGVVVAEPCLDTGAWDGYEAAWRALG